MMPIFSGRHVEGGLRNRSSLLPLIMIIFILLSKTIAGEWSVNGGIQYLNGDYIYTTATSTYYFTGGIRYQSSRWNASLSVPAIAQSNNLVSGSGGMFLPSHGGENSGGGGMSGDHHGGMHDGRIMTDNVEHHFEVGLGDVYLSGQHQFITGQNSLPTVALTAQIKFPTASTGKNFGTGEYDYGATLNLSKRLGNYAGFLDAGFWLLGDSPEIDYRNPVTYGIGIGRFFSDEQWSALLYYQGYTTILPDFDPPRQGSLGLYYRSSSQMILSLTATAGFSNTSPDFGLSIGVSRTF